MWIALFHWINKQGVSIHVSVEKYRSFQLCFACLIYYHEVLTACSIWAWLIARFWACCCHTIELREGQPSCQVPTENELLCCSFDNEHLNFFTSISEACMARPDSSQPKTSTRILCTQRAICTTFCVLKNWILAQMRNFLAFAISCRFGSRRPCVRVYYLEGPPCRACTQTASMLQ